MAHAPGPMSLCCFGSLQNGLGFWVEREIKDQLVPTSFHRQRHLSPFTRPTRCCWVCVGHEGCGQVPVPPHCCPWHGGGGVLPRLQPAPAPRRTCRRQRRSVRNGGKVEGTQGSKEKPDFSHLSSKRRASQFHGTFSMIETPAAPGGAGLLCLGVRWGWCPQVVTNSSKPVASFCGDSQVCASPSAPRLGHTPVITVFVFPSFVLEGSWM